MIQRNRAFDVNFTAPRAAGDQLNGVDLADLTPEARNELALPQPAEC